jgi:soluble lytic murein transglycosylase
VGRLRAAAVLLGLGLRAEALAELDALARRGPPRPVAGPLAELAAFAGDAELPFRVARDALGPGPRSLRWLYPEAVPGLDPGVLAAAGVEAHLALAVLRRESAFRAGARSAAGAVGLMQLVPSTAARLATLGGLPDRLAPRLDDPAHSAGLGVHYLALLLDRFGDPAPALAAYNAGPAAASRWAAERAGQPLDEWVESIPYRETRGYVKSVLAAREVYRRLAGDPESLDPARPVPAPGTGVAF